MGAFLPARHATGGRFDVQRFHETDQNANGPPMVRHAFRRFDRNRAQAATISFIGESLRELRNRPTRTPGHGTYDTWDLRHMGLGGHGARSLPRSLRMATASPP